MLIDLQIHSTYSDGYYNPKQLVGFLVKNKVRAAALTDHNTIGGQEQFQSLCRERKIKTVTGVEIYSQLGSMKFNVLWYGLDTSSVELHDMLRDSQKRRRRNIRNVLKALEKKGFEMNVEKIMDKFNHYVPVNRVCDEFLKVPGNFKKVKKELSTKQPREEKVIQEFFHNKKIGVLRNSFIDFNKIFTLKEKIGGHLVLCHPAKYSYISEEKINRLKKAGLDGVEILSPHHSYGAVAYLQYLAEKYDLIATGGSDFHKGEASDKLLKNAWQYFRIDSKNLRRINEIIG